ncbi:hypothetical protein ABK040_007522 [Willaertia magna]
MVKLRCKIGIVGDSTVGKTSLVKMFKDRSFPNQYVMTIGAELYTKSIGVPVPTENHPSEEHTQKEDQVELYMFDISGSSIYDAGYEQYIDGINAFIIVYDITNPETYSNLTKWYRLCKGVRASNTSQKKHDKSLIGVLVASKTDMHQFEKITMQQGEEFAKENSLQFFTTSASSDDGNIEQPFLYIADTFFKSYQERIEEIKYICEHKPLQH